MKNKNILLFLAGIVFLTGCDVPEARKIDTEYSAKNPEFVVDTPKGKLYRITIYQKHGWNDRIYFFETNNTVNINTDEGRGKSRNVKTTVIIDGVEYIQKR